VLIDAGASIAAQTKDGFQPLHVAVKQGHLSTAKLLIQEGAPTEVATNDGSTPLSLAKKANRNSAEMVGLLQPPGAAGSVSQVMQKQGPVGDRKWWNPASWFGGGCVPSDFKSPMTQSTQDKKLGEQI